MKIKGLTIVLLGLLAGCAQNVANSSSEEMAKSYVAIPSDKAYLDKSKQAAVQECAELDYTTQSTNLTCKVVSDTVIFRIKLKARYEWTAGFDFTRIKNHYKHHLFCADIPWIQDALKSGMAFQIQAVGKDQSELLVLEDCGINRVDVT
ncbi:hypothetical protein [Vibrio hippocampi]|uniref:Uncharacterized protein n=1 Tax=Vibrio hippocampi TaxID=654686 RepID=A0ABN8DDK7_9VIBR|nr:hypothetical protein [Vibrio hippocampi]CAH0525012.1 hypothetical protein VHP8226_00677 [Vibrio hippocampi]